MTGEAFDRRKFRRKLGDAVKQIQDAERDAGTPLVVVVPEMVAALLSLAVYIGKHNMNMSRQEMERAMLLAKREEWPPKVG